MINIISREQFIEEFLTDDQVIAIPLETYAFKYAKRLIAQGIQSKKSFNELRIWICNKIYDGDPNIRVVNELIHATLTKHRLIWSWIESQEF